MSLSKILVNFRDFRLKPVKFFSTFCLAAATLLLIAIFCLITGYSEITFLDFGHILHYRLKGEPFPSSLKQSAVILFELRLPRIWLGILVGGALSIAGCVFQGLLRNPLADPYILGVSAGAILGVAISVVLKLPGIFFPVLALTGAIASLFLVYFLALENQRFSSQTLLLAGVITNFFFSAILMFLMTKAGRQLVEIINMLMGSLAFVQTSIIGRHLTGIGIIVIFLSIWLWFYSRDLNTLALGDEMAQSMGVNVTKVKKILFILTSALVGLVVSLSGIIGFVGLIVPHTVRLLIGPNHRQLLPLCFIGGSIFLIVCDTAARSLSAVEIPVGVITAFFGAPFFAWLLKSKKSNWT